MDVIKDFMLPYGSTAIWLGPLLQPIRGLLFAIALWPIRDKLLKSKRGWLILWSLIVIIGILSTPSASPSSLEGLFYSKLPLWYHLIGFPEILLQTLSFSFILLWWDKSPVSRSQKKIRAIIKRVVTALSTACFAYIGYALGALLILFFSSPSGIDFGAVSAAGADFKIQFMFILAFIINAFTVYFSGPMWQSGKFKLWQLFFIYLLIDTATPWIYQALITPPGPEILQALLLGLLPSIIITLSIKYNYKKS